MYISCQQIPLQISDRSPNRKKIQSYFHFVQQLSTVFTVTANWKTKISKILFSEMYCKQYYLACFYDQTILIKASIIKVHIKLKFSVVHFISSCSAFTKALYLPSEFLLVFYSQFFRRNLPNVVDRNSLLYYLLTFNR